MKCISLARSPPATVIKTENIGSDEKTGRVAPAKREIGCWSKPTQNAARFLSWMKPHREPVFRLRRDFGFKRECRLLVAGTEDTIPDNAVIEAGGELVLDTGCTDAGADVRLGDYGNCQYDDDREFVVVLLSPDGTVVDRFTHSEDEQPEEKDELEEEPEEEEEPEDKPEEEEGAEEEEPEDEEEESDEEVDVPDEELPLEYEATLSGEAHGVETEASGYAFFQADSEEINYTVEVDYLCNATQAHIHLGGEDEDGPVVAWLYPEDGEEPELIEGRFDGVLADGTLTEDDFVGEWEGATIEEIKTTLDEEEAYVNIHTEEHSGGEIRGQIGIVDSL